MKTFFNPSLMFSFSRPQIGISNANVIKAKLQSPAFNITTQLSDVFSRIELSIIAHGQ